MAAALKGSDENKQSDVNVKSQNMSEALSIIVEQAKAESQILKLYVMPDNYNKWELPTVRDINKKFMRVPIWAGVLVTGFRGIDELAEHVTVELDLSTHWIDWVIKNFDKRTAEDIYKDNGVPYISLDSSFLERIWWPTMIFNDVVSVTHPNLHPTIHPKPVKLRIFNGGLIQMRTRLVLKLHCGMDFKYYPADTQTCVFRLRSYPFSDRNIKLQWDQSLEVNGKQGDPNAPYAVYLADRSDTSFNVFLHDIKTTNYKPHLQVIPANYTVLEFSISAKRKLNFHVMQTFIPSGLLILITWLSFLLPTSLLEARIGISMTTLLTLTSMFTSIKEFTPQVSYVKAVDIWMLVCIIVVFITLFESAFLIWLRKIIEENTKRKDGNSVFDNAIVKLRPNWRDSLLINVECNQNGNQIRNQKSLIYKKVMKSAEKYGFLIVAGFFVGFNLSFWPWLLISSGYFNNELNLENNAPAA